MGDIAETLRELNAALNPGASPQELSSFERESGLRLPKQVVDVYSITNGFEIDSLGTRFLSLKEMANYVSGMRKCGIPELWSYAALTDSDDSNPFCVCCGEHLNGYVVRVFHDDSAELEFRSITSLLRALQNTVTVGNSSVDDTESDFEGWERTDADIDQAKKLMVLSKSLEDVEYTDALCFAVTLFSKTNLEELRSILSFGNSYCREAAIQCLKKIGSPEALKVAADASVEFKRFVNACANKLYSAGLKATIVDETNIRLEPGPIWLNMDMFFDDRNNPNVMDRVVERAKHFVETRKHR